MSPINVDEAVRDWQDGAKAKVSKLVRKYKAKTGKVAAATSDAAQRAYVAGVTDPVSQRLRLTRLKELTDADLDKAMEDAAPVTYPAGIDKSVEKMRRRVSPFMGEIDRIVPTLKPRVRDAAANVTARVTPIAVGLQNKKKALVGGA